MTVRILLFAQARDRAGRSSVTLELPEGSRVGDALAELERLHPDLAALRPHLAVALNRKLTDVEAPIPTEAEIALLPPVSGGLATPARRGRRGPAPLVRATPDSRAVTVAPATAERWGDLERLFGPRGACAGCWCMWPRLEGAAYRAGKGAGNKRRLKRLVQEGPPPGLIAYLGDEPVGWCALAPRADYLRLARSRVLAPVDARPVWSVPCFFVARPYRGRGLTRRLLEEAVRWARSQGAEILEGYPLDPARGRTADAFAWWGLVETFRATGFREIERRSATRPIVRRTLRPRAAEDAVG